MLFWSDMPFQTPSRNGLPLAISVFHSARAELLKISPCHGNTIDHLCLIPEGREERVFGVIFTNLFRSF